MVTFCTLPPANLRIIQKIAIEDGKLTHPSYTAKQLCRQTDKLIDRVTNLNSRIKRANSNKQLEIKPNTSYTDNYCLKATPRKRYRVRKQLIVSSMPDGVHGSSKVQHNWYNTIWCTAYSEVRRLSDV